jgi:shikimate dehydrogenase
MHNHAFKLLGINFVYELKQVEPDKIAKFTTTKLRKDEVAGANVTIPYKVEIMKYLNRIDNMALKIGAVNTILNMKGTLLGYNTDGIGGIKTLKETYGDLSKSNVLVLGAGGASRALSYCLSQEVKSLTILNRSQEKATTLGNYINETSNIKVKSGSLEKIPEIITTTDILINTTSVGMSPHNEISLVPTNLLHSDLFVFDLVYNPLKTKLIKDAENANARTLTGVNMLVYQGAEAFKLWTGMEAPEKAMKKIVIDTLEAR